MPTSFGALCTDFYVNHKLSLKMDLPSDRETVLHLFDRMRKSVPSMDRFRKYEGEYVLESSRQDEQYQWLALRRKSIRTGLVNPNSMEQAYSYHRQVLEQAPYYLTISPLDVDCVELLLGFDLECKGNHDEIVADALFAGSPLGEMLDSLDAPVMDAQPILAMSLSEDNNEQVFVEVKTRRKGRRGDSERYADDPISVLLSVRNFGTVDNVKDLAPRFMEMATKAELLAGERLVPHVLTPIARHITSSSA